MNKGYNNSAFIDGQNLHLGVRSLGWRLDYGKFRRYLREKYGIGTAYLFLGYLQRNQALYASLQKDGYVLIFKPVFANQDGDVKGNVDADLVLQAMIEFPNYDKALIVTSDGDFYSLITYLYEKEKLLAVMSPRFNTCSNLLKKSAKEKMLFMDTLHMKLAYKRKSTA